METTTAAINETHPKASPMIHNKKNSTTATIMPEGDDIMHASAIPQSPSPNDMELEPNPEAQERQLHKDWEHPSSVTRSNSPEIENEEEPKDEDTSDPAPSPSPFCTRQKCMEFYWKNEFLILIILSIAVARAYPPLGATYVAPDITASWIAVCVMFLLAGLELKTQEFHHALSKVKFNLFVQIYNFGVVSVLVYAVSRLLQVTSILSTGLSDGMVIASCLPMTISMVLVLTRAAHGDEAAAVFHAALGSFIGVILSPLLILGYLGVAGNTDLLTVFYKLSLRVLLPVVVGQVLQKCFATVREFCVQYKPYLKMIQQYLLIFIVYTVFCQTFDGDQKAGIGNVFIMIPFIFLIIIGSGILSWYLLRLFFPKEPKLRVMGLMGCTLKTVAVGVPLISTIYQGQENLALYTLPILIWHPMQVMIGSFIAPRLAVWVDAELKRLQDQEEEQPRADAPVVDLESPSEVPPNTP